MGRIEEAGILLLICFYSAYMIKLWNQRKRGIQTDQLGIGQKSERTLWVEKGLKISSHLIVFAMVGSILWHQNFLAAKIRYLGLCITAVGVILFVLAFTTMKDNWRAGIPTTDQTELVSKGIYRWSRNPAFLGFDLFYLGMVFAFYNFLLLVAMVFAVVMLHLQILEEEEFMVKRFGRSYLEYKKKVGRYFVIL